MFQGITFLFWKRSFSAKVKTFAFWIILLKEWRLKPKSIKL